MILSPRDYSNSLCSALDCQPKLTNTSHMVETIYFKLLANCVLFTIASTVPILNFVSAFPASSTSCLVLQSLISKGMFQVRLMDISRVIPMSAPLASKVWVTFKGSMRPLLSAFTTLCGPY
jgi:hypothetical protein